MQADVRCVLALGCVPVRPFFIGFWLFRWTLLPCGSWFSCGELRRPEFFVILTSVVMSVLASCGVSLPGLLDVGFVQFRLGFLLPRAHELL